MQVTREIVVVPHVSAMVGGWRCMRYTVVSCCFILRSCGGVSCVDKAKSENEGQDRVRRSKWQIAAT